jgi:protein SCO1/2
MIAPRNRGFASRSIVFVLIAAVAGGLGLVLAQRLFAPAPVVQAPLALKSVRLIEPARPLPEFQLTRSDGSTLGVAQLRGHWTLVFIGFTHCPDVCPTTLTTLARAQKAWESIPEARRPRLLFVSVDPERDTPKALGDYAHYFHPDTIAATAIEPALGEFVKALGLVYMKVPQANGDYEIDHSSTLVLLDPQGRQAGLVRPPLLPDAIAADLALLAERRP